MPLAAVLTLLVCGCGGGEGTGAADAGTGLAVAWVDPDGEPPYIGSLSVNPADGSLLMGTNTGLFEIGRDGGEPVKVTGELTTPEGPARSRSRWWRGSWGLIG